MFLYYLARCVCVYLYLAKHSGEADSAAVVVGEVSMGILDLPLESIAIVVNPSGLQMPSSVSKSKQTYKQWMLKLMFSLKYSIKSI